PGGGRGVGRSGGERHRVGPFVAFSRGDLRPPCNEKLKQIINQRHLARIGGVGRGIHGASARLPSAPTGRPAPTRVNLPVLRRLDARFQGGHQLGNGRSRLGQRGR